MTWVLDSPSPSRVWALLSWTVEVALSSLQRASKCPIDACADSPQRAVEVTRRACAWTVCWCSWTW